MKRTIILAACGSFALTGCVVTRESDPPGIDVDPPQILSVILDVTPAELHQQVCDDMGGHLINGVCIDVDY